MKKFKKFSAAIAATLIAASLSVPMAASLPASAAASANTISFKDEVAETGHTYTAYRIFSGTVEGPELKNVQWANPDGANALVTAMKADEALSATLSTITVPESGVVNAAAVAKALGGLNSDEAGAKVLAKVIAANTNLVEKVGEAGPSITTGTTGDKDGYYLIVESDMTGQTDSAMTAYILNMYDASEGAEIAVKSAIPSVEKKIKENTKTGDWDTDNGYNDTADFCKGDIVPFKLTGTMPSNLDRYDTYKYVFHDNIAANFSDPTNFKVYLNTVSEANDVTSSFTVVTTNLEDITISCDNVKAIDGVTATTKIIVTYDATLSNPVIGQPGQKNTVYLEYSNNPNNGGSGTSNSKPDTVIAFTYELDVTKIDGTTDAPLEGAEFKFYRMNGESKEYAIVADDGKLTGWGAETAGTTLKSGTDGIFKVIGIDDGTYYLDETKAPAGYNELTEDIKVVVSADTSNSQTDNTIDGTELTALNITVDAGTAQAGDVDSGIVEMDVKNNSGTTLPSTGGIGTTLFYVGGGCMVALAGVFLITKKRMNKKED